MLLSVVIGLFATVATPYSMGDREESPSIAPREPPLGIRAPPADTGQNINFDVVAHLCCPPGVPCGNMVGKLNEKFAQFQISFDLKKLHQFSDPRCSNTDIGGQNSHDIMASVREGGQSTLNYLFLSTNSGTYGIKGFTLDPPQDFTKPVNPQHDGPHCDMVLLTREGTFSEIDQIIMVHDTRKPVLVRTTKYVYVFASANILHFESSRKAEVRQVALMRQAADGAGATEQEAPRNQTQTTLRLHHFRQGPCDQALRHPKSAFRYRYLEPAGWSKESTITKLSVSRDAKMHFSRCNSVTGWSRLDKSQGSTRFQNPAQNPCHFPSFSLSLLHASFRIRYSVPRPPSFILSRPYTFS
ncbi:hypothetical protein HRG_012250 [Hirsutella rhossiliensis]